MSGSLIQYPSEDHIRDYFKWRQVDSKIDSVSKLLFLTRNSIIQFNSTYQQPLQYLLLGTCSAGWAHNERCTRRTPSESYLRIQLDYNRLRAIKLCSQGTFSSQKNEMLFSRFSINYNEIDLIYRRGSILLKRPQAPQEQESESGKKKKKALKMGPIEIVHEDMLKDEWWITFWAQRTAP